MEPTGEPPPDGDDSGDVGREEEEDRDTPDSESDTDREPLRVHREEDEGGEEEEEEGGPSSASPMRPSEGSRGRREEDEEGRGGGARGGGRGGGGDRAPTAPPPAPTLASLFLRWPCLVSCEGCAAAVAVCVAAAAALLLRRRSCSAFPAAFACASPSCSACRSSEMLSQRLSAFRSIPTTHNNHHSTPTHTLRPAGALSSRPVGQASDEAEQESGNGAQPRASSRVMGQDAARQ